MTISWEQAAILAVPVSAFGLTALSLPIAGRLARRWGCIAIPSAQRWHTRPTPTLGGLAFWPAVLLVVLFASPDPSKNASLFIITTAMFAVGMYDDLHHIRPVTKLICQLIAALSALSFGYRLNVFSWAPFDAMLTVTWIVGLTNAVNLLDNMDGLAAGIGLIAASYLAFLFN